MKRIAFAGIAVGVVVVLSIAGEAQAPTPLPSVWLQPGTPGIVQGGHLNISGTVRAGTVSANSAEMSSFRLGTSTTSGLVLKSDFNAIGTWQVDSLALPFNPAPVSLDTPFSIETSAAFGKGLSGIATGLGGVGVYARAPLSSYAIFCDGHLNVQHSANIQGDLGADGDVFLWGTTTVYGFVYPVGAAQTYVLTADASGNGTWQPATGLSIPYNGSASAASSAVFAVTNTAATGINYGLFGQSNSSSGRGVYGFSGNGYGVYGETTNNIAVYGIALAATGTTYGVYGQNNSTTGRAVYGQASGTGTCNGVRGFASVASTGYGVYSNGDTGASGTKSFVIDHPFDPENKYLKHYSSEGPEPLNVYTGNVVTDAKGVAYVELPNYFAEINKDFRYTLTVVDDTDSEDFVFAKVAREIRDNRFKIRTSAPHVKVTWRVEGVRNDLWVRTRGAPVEVEKDVTERGKYQQPELYGMPKELGTDFLPPRGATIEK